MNGKKRYVNPLLYRLKSLKVPPKNQINLHICLMIDKIARISLLLDIAKGKRHKTADTFEISYALSI
jgi:hypothetical protein